jgi:hypothetical protein
MVQFARSTSKVMNLFGRYLSSVFGISSFPAEFAYTADMANRQIVKRIRGISIFLSWLL